MSRNRLSSRGWATALVVMAATGVLLAVFVAEGRSRLIPGSGSVANGQLGLTRVELSPGQIRMLLLNESGADITIAQVMVEYAFWAFSAVPSTRVAPWHSAEITIPYPWTAGEPTQVRLLSSTGATYDFYDIGAGTYMLVPDTRFMLVLALVGLYVGVLPVALGLLWDRLRPLFDARARPVVAAGALGLMAFLLVEAMRSATTIVVGAPRGLALFTSVALTSFAVLGGIGWLMTRREGVARRAWGPTLVGWPLAVLAAIAIGLHNLGEGLVIGGAVASGGRALGVGLILILVLHQTSQGFALAIPIASEGAKIPRPHIGRLVELSLIAIVPTILGSWLGRSVSSPAPRIVCIALGVGAIAYVCWHLAMLPSPRGLSAFFRTSRALPSGLLGGVAYQMSMLLG